MQTFHYVRLNLPNQTSAIAAITEDDNKYRQTPLPQERRKRSLAYSDFFWENASTLKISFLHDIPLELKDRVERIIRQWEPFVSLAFEVVEDYKGEIRIALGGQESYSTIGTQALTVDTRFPTMTIGVEPDNLAFERTLLHEFGHALGFHHAHLHPEANIPWNKPVVYDFFETVFGWSKEQINHNLFDLDSTHPLSFGKYDKDSIMHYPIQDFMTVSNWQTGINSTLSEGDKMFARQIYPPIKYLELPI
ncbi:M12 family metallopeptidase [Pseudomonas sp. FP2196]|uniref:M12 family metallopeptidase n=1 Tax=Pseudomonas sp. FP2196 TaxID=2954086 RepID=UPI0027327C24|nr:M12 family metallopeptidase [Pseudomonas sp. FP2196]WLH36773.1 M12 family metallopeptidase [Pseudomonas sp. FP2196]